MSESTTSAGEVQARSRLKTAIARLAAAIDRGEIEPHPIELHALALICDDEELPAEAARVRRWLRGPR